MSLILILIGNFFVFIMCLIGAQMCFFERRWKWFSMAVLCVLVSGACIGDEMYQCFVHPQKDLTSVLPPLQAL